MHKLLAVHARKSNLFMVVQKSLRSFAFMPFFALPSRRKILSLAPWSVAFVFVLALSWGVAAGGAMGGIGIGGGVLAAIWAGGAWPERRVGVGVCVVLLWGWFSSFYALDSAIAQETTLKMSSIFIPLLLWTSPSVQEQGRKNSDKIVLFSLILCVGLWILDGILAFKMLTVVQDKQFILSKLNRGFSYGALLTFPILAALFKSGGKREKLVAWLVLFSAGSALLLTNSRATQTGVGLALALFVLGRVSLKAAFGVMTAGVFLSLFWPFVAAFLYATQPEFVSTLPDSWLARMEIWDYVAHRIFERPWLGYGMGNSSLLDILHPHGALYVLTKTPASHPHNAVAQLWSDLGIVGVAFGFAFALSILGRIRLLCSQAQPYALAAYALAFWLAMVAYSLWTDSFWAALVLTAFAFQTLSCREKKSS